MEVPSWHKFKPELKQKSGVLFFPNLKKIKGRGKIILLSAVFLGLITLASSLFFIVKNSQARASLTEISDTTPYDVKFTEVSSSGFSIEWKTKESTIGFIKYGTTEIVLDLIGQAENDPGGYKKSHKIEVAGLDSGMKYYVEVHSNAQAFGEEGNPLSVETLD